MEKGAVATPFSDDAKLKRKIRAHFTSLGFVKANDGTLVIPGEGKDVVRRLHGGQRRERLAASATFITEKLPGLLPSFADGSEIDPSSISLKLVRVRSGTREGDLFRLAALTWSVPVSVGFGRRLRYLVWDEAHERLAGIIALGDPVFNLAVRDDRIGWNVTDRSSRLVNVLDAYVLGAVPPYNQLLGGKAVACLVRSQEVYRDFREEYGNVTGIISGKVKNANLLVVTTSSSMGRSSVYNRLRLADVSYFDPIGFTLGWGHFHIPDGIFKEMREYLRTIGHSYADEHRFGQGPNWRLRTIRAALRELRINESVLRHGIQREVFLCSLAPNASEILRTGKGRPDLSSLQSASEISDLAIARWMVPRGLRTPQFKAWRRENIQDLILGTESGVTQVSNTA